MRYPFFNLPQFPASIPGDVDPMEITVLRQNHQESARLHDANFSPADDAVENMTASLMISGQQMEMIAGNVQPLHEIRCAKTDQCSGYVPELKDALIPGSGGQRWIGWLLARDTPGLGGLNFNFNAERVKGIERRKLLVELQFERMETGDISQNERAVGMEE